MSAPLDPYPPTIGTQGVRAMCTLNVPSRLGRITQVIAGVDDKAYILNPDGSVYQCPTDGIFEGETLQCAAARGFAYFVDGKADIYVVNVLAGGSADVTVFAASEGSLPIDVGDEEGPSLIAFYRDRMVLAGVPGDEQNFFMSRSGTHDDFDYGQTDPAAAVAGNLSLGASIGSPIRALIPWRDDLMVFGCDHSIWRMIGDIAAGGSIQLLTDAVGVFGPNAWTTDHAGNLYFMGESDFYRLDPSGALKNLSSTRIHKLLSTIDRNNDTVIVQWDNQRMGCYIFITKPRPTDPSDVTHSTTIWYDARLDAFLPLEIPRAYDPICSVGYSGTSEAEWEVLLGNRSGYIMRFDDSAATDNGTTIESRLAIGPVRPSGLGFRESKCNGLDFILGDTPTGYTDSHWNLDYTLKAGKDAKEAFDDPTETRTGTITGPGKRHPVGVRCSGSQFMLHLSNDTWGKIWSLEQLFGRFLRSGRLR